VLRIDDALSREHRVYLTLDALSAELRTLKAALDAEAHPTRALVVECLSCAARGQEALSSLARVWQQLLQSVMAEAPAGELRDDLERLAEVEAARTRDWERGPERSVWRLWGETLSTAPNLERVTRELGSVMQQQLETWRGLAARERVSHLTLISTARAAQVSAPPPEDELTLADVQKAVSEARLKEVHHLRTLHQEGAALHRSIPTERAALQGWFKAATAILDAATQILAARADVPQLLLLVATDDQQARSTLEGMVSEFGMQQSRWARRSEAALVQLGRVEAAAGSIADDERAAAEAIGGEAAELLRWLTEPLEFWFVVDGVLASGRLV